MLNKTDCILPDSIAIYDHMAAFDLTAKHYLDSVQLKDLLVYLVDQVDARALPILAEQFDVLGNKGWNLCNTDAEKRALIKRAIELHRYKGTIWAIRESLKSIGFQSVRFFEHIAGHWANFKVELISGTAPITANSIAMVHLMIDEYKNVRSNLVEVFITVSENDTMTFTDDADMIGDMDMDDYMLFSNKLYHDGTADHDGTYDHSGDSDLIDFF